MKKTLIGLLALLASCSLFAACDILNGGSSSPDSSTPDSSTPDSSISSVPDSSTSQDSHAEALELAKEFVYGQLVEKDVEVRSDYTLINSYYSFVLEETLTISWTVDVTEGVTLENGESECKVNVDKNLEEDLFYVLTATISDSDGHTATFTLERKVLKAAQVIPEKITEAPAEETAYKLYMYQETKKSDLYFTGTMSGFYLATTNASNGDTYEDGVDVYVEKVAGKDAFYLTFTKDNKKQYIGVANNWSNGSYHDNAILADSTEVKADEIKTFEFTWSTEYNTLVATLDGVKSGKVEDTTETRTDTFFLGTSGSYYTFGACPVKEAADSYVGCLVKMINKTNVSAADKVAAEKEILNITNVYSGAVEANLPTTGTTFGDVSISWKVKSGNATVENNVLKVAAPTEDTTIILTATLTCGEASDTANVEITVYPKSLITLVSAPEEGTAYAFYLYQANKAKNYYFTGEMDGSFLGTTDDASKAADVYVEKSGSGIKIYVLGENDAKSYIKLTEYKKNETDQYYKASVSLDAEGSVFTYNSQFSMWTCNTGNDTFYLGTYNDYTTISSSAASYVKVDNVGITQFVANFGIIDESALPPDEGDDNEPEVNPPVVGDILATFEFGENVDVSDKDDDKKHVDGNIIDEGKAYTSGNYTLTLTGVSKVYDGANDNTGISCLKVGTSDTVGTFTFTVPDDVKSVALKVAMYKAKTTKVTVNGKEYAITTSSNDGAYTTITINTATTKTLTIATVSGATRTMINSIAYIATEGGDVITSGGDEDTPPTETPTFNPITSAPVANVEYTFYATDATSAYYFAGYTSGYYCNATTDATQAVTVYAELVAGSEGSFYLYYLNSTGAKQYIVTYASGTYVNNKTTTNVAEATAYYFNTEYNVVVIDLLETTYYLGYYNNTWRASKLSYAATSAVGHLQVYTASEGGSTDTPTVPTFNPITSAPVANVEYTFYAADDSSAYYFAGYTSGYYCNATTDATQAVTVYAELVAGSEGSFYLYYLDSTGAKQYIVTYASGTYVNNKTTTNVAEATAYYFNTEYNVVVIDLLETTYYLGYYNNTWRASKLSYAATSAVGHLQVKA